MCAMSESEFNEYIRELTPNDEGLPCCCASLLIAYWRGDASGVLSWAENMAHRLWLPAVWDEMYTLRACATHVGLLASACARALVAAGSDYPEGAYDRGAGFGDEFGRCMREVADILGLDGSGGRGDFYGYGSARSRVIRPAGYDVYVMQSAATCMRYLWLARLHERNGRYDPTYDWNDAHTEARVIGIDGNASPEAIANAATRLLAAPFVRPTDDEYARLREHFMRLRCERDSRMSLDGLI